MTIECHRRSRRERHTMGATVCFCRKLAAARGGPSGGRRPDFKSLTEFYEPWKFYPDSDSRPCRQARGRSRTGPGPGP